MMNELLLTIAPTRRGIRRRWRGRIRRRRSQSPPFRTCACAYRSRDIPSPRGHRPSACRERGHAPEGRVHRRRKKPQPRHISRLKASSNIVVSIIAAGDFQFLTSRCGPGPRNALSRTSLCPGTTLKPSEGSGTSFGSPTGFRLSRDLRSNPENRFQLSVPESPLHIAWRRWQMMIHDVLQPLTAPSVSPRTMWRCSTNTTASTGNSAVMPTTAISPQRTP